ncbi:MAG: hypothetical protein Q8R05_03030, partial [Candidatus Omnitrophota bacterium]|nr:hypothetical protein [Candidatus Omnitrophota bacterium]
PGSTAFPGASFTWLALPAYERKGLFMRVSAKGAMRLRLPLISGYFSLTLNPRTSSNRYRSPQSR